jgi:hypothetical protein
MISRTAMKTLKIALMALLVVNGAKASEVDCVYVTQKPTALLNAPKANAKVVARLQSGDDYGLASMAKKN